MNNLITEEGEYEFKGCFRIATFSWVIWAFSAQNAQNFKRA
jgi:hypothetical protein